MSKLVGIRYCGGCNPRHDRTALVSRLQAECLTARFEIAQPGTRYDLLLVVCGCPARCADYAVLGHTGPTLVVSGEAEDCRAKEFILSCESSIKTS